MQSGDAASDCLIQLLAYRDDELGKGPIMCDWKHGPLFPGCIYTVATNDVISLHAVETLYELVFKAGRLLWPFLWVKHGWCTLHLL